MFRQIARLSQRLTRIDNLANRPHAIGAHIQTPASRAISTRWQNISQQTTTPIQNNKCGILTNLPTQLTPSYQPVRCFHAADSKVKYLDFRYRLKTNHLRLHLLIIRRQKMKKHKRRKFRKRFKFLLSKQRLKREIAKEKAFRVELLTMIRKAETFDPKEYALRKLDEIKNRPKELSREEKLLQLKELIRQNRYQVDYIKPAHKRVDWVDVKV